MKKFVLLSMLLAFIAACTYPATPTPSNTPTRITPITEPTSTPPPYLFVLEPSRLTSYYRKGAFGAAGDIDGDGDFDIVISNVDYDEKTEAGRQGPLYIYINDGSGQFTNETDVWLGGETILAATRGMALVDLTLDGWLDVVLATESLHQPPWTDYPDRILINQGGTHFKDETQERLPYGPIYSHSVCVGDANNDGAPDLFFNTNDRLLINDGSGFFNSLEELPGLSFHQTLDCAFADFDLDGDNDLFLSTNLDYDRNELFLNDGQAGFSRASKEAIPPKIEDGNTESVHVVAADFNSDQYPDLIICNFYDPYTGATWQPQPNQLLLNNGDGTFRDETENGLMQSFDGGITLGVAIGDLDGDNNLDLVFANNPPIQGTFVYFGNGDGSFKEVSDVFSRPLSLSYMTDQVLIFDMDNDGDNDIVFLGKYGKHMVYRNITIDP